MVKKKRVWLLFTLIVLLLAGCAPAGEPAGAESAPPAESTVAATSAAATEGTPLEAFMRMVPDARIHDVLEYDLDGDGGADYLILYASEELSCGCGISVWAADSVYSSIDLSGGQGFRFASQAALDAVDGAGVLSVQLEDPEEGALYLYTVACSVDRAAQSVNFAVKSAPPGDAPTAEAAAPAIQGYVWDPSANRLQAYAGSPEECLPPLSPPAADAAPYVAPEAPSGGERALVSYAPASYAYDCANALFRIGTVRIDNSANLYSDATLAFSVFQGGSCAVTLTTGAGAGGEEEALFAMASAAFGDRVASQVSWSAGTAVPTDTAVPPGAIGRVTGYVVGISSAGTATYSSLDPATGQRTYETVDIAGLIPARSAWNLVVETPCS